MRKFKTIVALSFVATMPLVMALSCNPSLQKTTYQTLATTEAGVLAANQGYLDLVVTGQVPTNSVPTVEATFNDTQLAIRTAIALASLGTNSPTPAIVTAKAVAFTNTINQATRK